MWDITLAGYGLFLRNAFWYCSWWYFGYWLLPLAILGILMLIMRKRKVSSWQQLGKDWASIGWIMIAAVSLMYVLTILVVPARGELFKVADGGQYNMEKKYQTQLNNANKDNPGYGADDIAQNPLYCKNPESGRRIIWWFYHHYRWTHSVLPWLVWTLVMLFVFGLPGSRMSKEKMAFAKD